jgi:hypothetical protein
MCEMVNGEASLTGMCCLPFQDFYYRKSDSKAHENNSRFFLFPDAKLIVMNKLDYTASKTLTFFTGSFRLSHAKHP